MVRHFCQGKQHDFAPRAGKATSTPATAMLCKWETLGRPLNPATRPLH